MVHFAHSGLSRLDRSDWQPLIDHLLGVEALAREKARPFGLSETAGLAGRFHDLGKYDPAFDCVLTGQNVRVDHSTAGGRVLLDLVPKPMRPVAEILAYAILGHHAGLPDKSKDDDRCLDRRVQKPGAALSPEWQHLTPPDFAAVSPELLRLMRQDPTKAGFDLSVAARMVFSCLVDADYADTEAYYDRLEKRSKDRSWPALRDVLPDLRARFDTHMAGFSPSTDLNRLRADILAHVRAKAALPPGLFTLSVPTGGGKTLASLGFALDHAAQHGHRRIIYAIPYTSIIDQTADIFRNLLGDIVLEHHSSVEDDGHNREGRDKLQLAMEDWAAPIIVTTNVQLFESLFAARPSRCRKLHNIAGSVIVLDEAQCLPRSLLLPTLAMIDTLATHYGCSVVICTATQPAFDSAQLRQGLALAGRELAPDPDMLARRLKRVTIRQGGTMTDEALITALGTTPQGFVIVNSRKHALALYQAGMAAGLDGMVHLTTRQTPFQRRQIIADIRDRLARGVPCRLVATSLIEAGVNLDFPVGWRAEAGLDSVIQAAGRVNREGRWPVDASILTVFSSPDNAPPPEVAQLAKAMQSTAGKFEDILDLAAIRDWFTEVYWRAGPGRLDKAEIGSKFVLGANGTDFAFRTVAEAYRMIDSTMVPVIIQETDDARALVTALDHAWEPPGKLLRALQGHVVQIPAKQREVLRTTGKGDFAAQDLRGDQFFVLKEPSLYTPEIGLWWEQAAYLTAD
ncbi:MAG: CRISPR-associated endonuclease Cas3'' [Rhodobacteraceae bacterium PARR1]|nr:MAG: CRISPR-associated endonuclease Cas3'' [Rhodobacteraceae bacterium PARR1]